MPHSTRCSSMLHQRLRSARSFATKATNGLAKVKSVLAVASGKGGVGKSSVCVNLAYTMQRYMGLKVGLLDADIYGPSLPSLLPASVAEKVYGSEGGGILPLYFRGVPLMSMGFLRPGEHAPIRGPMASAMIKQMLTTTEWGDLDLLLVDLPPGTGDIHLTVAQEASIDAAVVITTPQQLSLVDVEKGIRMFDQVKVPTVAIVENMSFFVCDGCEKRHEIFKGSSETLAKDFGIQRFFRFPLTPLMARAGMPFILEDDSSNIGSLVVKEFQRLATEAEAALIEIKGSFQPSLRAEVAGALLILRTEEGEWALPAREVLLECRSAKMRDEITGQRQFQEEEIPESVTAAALKSAGRYAMYIQWSNDHRSLFSFEHLKEIAEKKGQVWGKDR